MIVDDTIATLYIDDVALNTRMYRKPGGAVSLGVTDGSLKAVNIEIAKGLKRQS
jgi:beta-fructofuranosidase